MDAICKSHRGHLRTLSVNWRSRCHHPWCGRRLSYPSQRANFHMLFVCRRKTISKKTTRRLPCVGSTLNTMMQKYNLHICTFLFPNKNTAYVSIECIEYLPVPMIPENVSTNDIAQKDVYNYIISFSLNKARTSNDKIRKKQRISTNIQKITETSYLQLE